MTTVLVVDDDAILCRMLNRSLKSLGYQVEGCGTTALALQRLSAGGIDAVLLDLVLGQENGWETLRLIRQKGRVPVLLLTGALVTEEMAEDARLMGAQGVVMKPFEAAELAARIREELDEP